MGKNKGLHAVCITAPKATKEQVSHALRSLIARESRRRPRPQSPALRSGE